MFSQFLARQSNAGEKGMISRGTIEAFVSNSVVNRDKQKHGIRKINEKCLFSNTQEFLHNIFIKSFK